MAKNQPVPQTQQTVTTQVLSPEQRELMQLGLPGVREFAASVPQRYQGTQIAGFDPSQTASQEMALGAAPTQATLANTSAGTVNRLLGDLTDVNSNPALRGAIDVASRPIRENLLQAALPAIRSGAQGAGQFAGTRRGIAEGLAIQGAERATGDVATNLVDKTYDTNLKATLSALGLVPSVQQQQLAPALTTGAVGDVRQAMAQALLGQQVAGFNYDQLAPYLQSREILSLVGGLPGGSNVGTSTASTPQPASRLTQALGGAATGASIGSAFGPYGTAAGAVGGALLPFAFG